MSSRKYVLAAMVAALLVGGLAGCRSRRPAQQPSTTAAQPAPRTVYPSSGPSQPPMVSQAPTSPQPYTPTYSAPSRVMASRPAPPPADWGGSPDGMSSSSPAPFPSPGADAVVSTNPGPVIRTSAHNSAALDSRIQQLSNQIANLESALAEPAVAPSSTGGMVASGDGAARAAAFADQLRGRVSSEVVQNGNVVIVRLEDAFQSGSDRLKKSAAIEGALLTTAGALQQAGAREVLVVGHTDSDPIKKSKWSSNKALSEARAQRVVSELTRNGVPAGNLEVIGEGASQPLVKENSRAAKARNRRVEIHVRF